MWCDVRGLRAVALSSVGCRQLGYAALLLEGSGGMSGQPRMWCDVRGLRAVALSSVGCRQLGYAALLLEGSGGMSGQPRKAVSVDCARHDGAVDVGATTPRESLGRSDFGGNDDDGSEVGDAAMVAVVGSSPACPQYCLGMFVVVESKLRWRGPAIYDDWLQVARSAISRGASRAWFCPSEF
ncbi:Ubiquitin carboxyl-terminal hydrolase 9 [Hordeum vulgare]|nr:Ubiquitin carboxyl-terminal hydrolase 9 [Hordeum vulgare]